MPSSFELLESPLSPVSPFESEFDDDPFEPLSELDELLFELELFVFWHVESIYLVGFLSPLESYQ